jgi:hypothetical protein
MTSLAVSLSIDARGPCALYIITDSRITWQTAGKRWDSGQKAFASRKTPDIFGFCGNAYFPPVILNQMLEQINSGLLFAPDDSAAERHDRVKEVLGIAVQKQTAAPITPFTIYHGARDGELMSSRFRVWKTDYSAATDKWYDNEHNLDESKSYLARIDGSGRNAIESRGADWLKTDARDTSRSAVWSFCEALASGSDPFSGGAPQLVGIWRKGPAQNFGIIWQGQRYLAGLQVPQGNGVNNLQWFNELFERCDGDTGMRLKDAQPHLKPAIADNLEI